MTAPPFIFLITIPPTYSFLKRRISTANKTLPLIANLERRLTLGADGSQRVRTQGHSGRHRSPRRHPLRLEYIHHPLGSLLRITELVATGRRERGSNLIVDFHVVRDRGAIVFHVRPVHLGSEAPDLEYDGLDTEVRSFDL